MAGERSPQADSPRHGGPGAIASRRYSGLAAASGRRAANVVEAAPPPVERPWWMKLHGEGPPVSNLEEVMDQFLIDPEMRALERACDRSTAKSDVRHVYQVVPGIDKEDAENLLRWQGQVSKFLKYRDLVYEKHEHQRGIRANRPRARFDSADTLTESEDSTDEDSKASSASPARRRASGGRHPHRSSRPQSGRRPSNAGPMSPTASSPRTRRPSNADSAAATPRTRRPSNADPMAAAMRKAASSPPAPTGMSPRVRRPSNADAFMSRGGVASPTPSRLSKVGALVVTPTASDAPTPTPRRRASRKAGRFPSSH